MPQVIGQGGNSQDGVQGTAGVTTNNIGASGVAGLANPNGNSNGVFGSTLGNVTNSAGRFRGMVEFNSQSGTEQELLPGPAHIRMIPLDLNGQTPNHANGDAGIPGVPGDLLAVLGVPTPFIASLWFNVTGGPKGWSLAQGGPVGQ
jgi:hypothetical protein